MQNDWHREKKDGGTQTRLWLCSAFAKDWLAVISKCQMELMEISELICHQYRDSSVKCVMWASRSEKNLS